MIAYCPQDGFIFEGTLFENIFFKDKLLLTKKEITKKTNLLNNWIKKLEIKNLTIDSEKFKDDLNLTLN